MYSKFNICYWFYLAKRTSNIKPTHSIENKRITTTQSTLFSYICEQTNEYSTDLAQCHYSAGVFQTLIGININFFAVFKHIYNLTDCKLYIYSSNITYIRPADSCCAGICI